MAASKRKQDEKHLKILREMVALPHNKHCFDCHQRGPTYVNMTIGSFVCTSCSGVLRGLNPPHRVKSISMTSFTPEEMEFLRCHGNDFNRKVYLGLFDSRSQTEPDSKDEQKIKDFMAQKYEKKRWHVAPTQSMQEEAKRLNDTSANKKPETRPLKSLLGNNIPKFNVPSPNDQSKSQVPSMPQPPGPASRPSVPPSSSQPTFTIPQGPAAGRAPLTKQESKSSSVFDLLGDLGGADPFAAPAAARPQPQAQFNTASPDDGFANFESAFSNDFASAAPAPTSTPFSTPVSQQSSSFGSFTSATMPGTGSTMMSPSTASTQAPAPPTSTMSQDAQDRYAALANLDSVFGGGTSGSHTVSWDGGQSGQSSWAASFPSSTTAQAPVNNFNANSAFSSSTASNPFGSTPAPPSYNQVQQMAATSTSANPFLASSQQQPAGGGFAQFGSPTTAQSSGFGNFSATPATTSSNFGMQNGGFTTSGWGQAPAQPQQNQAFGQPFGQTQPAQQQFGQQPFGQGQGQMSAFSQPGASQPGFGMQSGAQFGKQSFGMQQQQPFGAPPQQQQMGGWGQPPPASNASNPFMNTGVPTQQGIPPNSTNPFL
ncbi:arf-GAP domain and FG repeat-containing protein 1-like [Lineus longissimus]|uniref:arf-GAP domain and FG repeat-containing protein 1-like n=1 Tax=Lineus longissimus TaxID=88925 RepID=UPI002B4EF98A